MKRLLLIGGGHMGEALVAGLVRSRRWSPAGITVCDVRSQVRRRLARLYRVRTSAENGAAAAAADVLLLAVKPSQMPELLEELRPAVRPAQLVLSIAAGIPTSRIERDLPKGTPVIRVMPNTPALIGMGAAAYARGRFARPAHGRTAAAIFSTVGSVAEVPEALMDAVTAVSGSGPAYVFYVAEALRAAGIALGLPASRADALVRQTLRGAAELLAQSAEDPQVLRRRVTSPGGTTEAAIGVLDQQGVRKIFREAVRRAAARSRELCQAAG